MNNKLDLDHLEHLAHKRIEMPGAPWITGTQVLALIRRIREVEEVRNIHSGKRVELEAIRSNLEEAIEMAWGIIANVSNGDWGKQSVEWHEAAEEWRDRYISGRNK